MRAELAEHAKALKGIRAANPNELRAYVRQQDEVTMDSTVSAFGQVLDRTLEGLQREIQTVGASASADARQARESLNIQVEAAVEMRAAAAYSDAHAEDGAAFKAIAESQKVAKSGITSIDAKFHVLPMPAAPGPDATAEQLLLRAQSAPVRRPPCPWRATRIAPAACRRLH